MKEVDYKAAKISKKPEKQCEKWGKKAINVVVGPGGRLFVTDHHHGALAWSKVERERKEPALTGICEIVNSAKGLTAYLRIGRRVLADHDGKAPCSPLRREGS
jgi:hypothetical protein